MAAQVKPAPFIWRWPLKKVRRVVGGTVDTSFTMWGRDLPRLYELSGSTSRAYVTEVALLAALLFTVSADYMNNVPDINPKSLLWLGNMGVDSEAIGVDVYLAAWTMCTIILLACVFVSVFFIITLSLLSDQSEATAYLLVRLGKVQKLPLQLFVLALGVGECATLTWCVLSLHWIACIVIVGGAMLSLMLTFVFFLFPMVGAMYDTLEAERSGALADATNGEAGGAKANEGSSINVSERARNQAWSSNQVHPVDDAE